MTTTGIAVTGMTCGHCVASLTEELNTLDGVSDVQVDLQAGGASPVHITSAAALDPAAVHAAVAEAGYQIA